MRMRPSFCGLELVAAALFLTPQICPAQVPASSERTLTCPRLADSRSVSGTVRDVGGAPINLAVVIVLNSHCATQSDSFGRWSLEGVQTTAATLQASFIGYRTTRIALSASEHDTAEVAFRLGRVGEPDRYMAEPIPEADLLAMLDAVIVFYAGKAGAIGNELDTAAAMSGSPPPSRHGGSSAVVIVTTGPSGWLEVPTAWLESHKADGTIAASCDSWSAPECITLGLTTFLELPHLPRRASPDTAFVIVRYDVLSPVDCAQRVSMGHFSEDLLRLTRTGSVWEARVAPGGLQLEGTVMCEPVDSLRH